MRYLLFIQMVFTRQGKTLEKAPFQPSTASLLEIRLNLFLR